MSKRWIGSIAALALLLASASAVAGAFSKTYERIPGWDGAQMGALVLVPQGQGAGPFPLIVMPASWSLPNLEYLGRATQLASDGYVVVSYTSRGFWDSAGQIDIAGPDTVEDVSAVIDWALAHTPAKPDAIGASGISYGAGISLLAAERDPRIKAVAALSGWADLEASLYSNRTVSQQGVGLLVGAGALTGRAGPDLAQIGARVAQGDYDGAVQGFLPQAASRSPATDVAALNARGTAVLLGNAFNDGLFPPNQTIAFFNQLRGPKQLLLSQGDHATAELPGALGLPNEIYTATTRWFDRHLKQLRNGVDAEAPVRLSPRAGAVAGLSGLGVGPTGHDTAGSVRTSRLAEPHRWIDRRDVQRLAIAHRHRRADGGRFRGGAGQRFAARHRPAGEHLHSAGQPRRCRGVGGLAIEQHPAPGR